MVTGALLTLGRGEVSQAAFPIRLADAAWAGDPSMAVCIVSPLARAQASLEAHVAFAAATAANGGCAPTREDAPELPARSVR